VESFHWGKQFENGLTEVDRQHHFLVDLINRFGDLRTPNAQGLAERYGNRLE